MARTQATSPYEIGDNLYNLACVYAIRGERQEMLEVLRHLQQRGGNLSSVRAHLDDYFARFRHDPDFAVLVGL